MKLVIARSALQDLQDIQLYYLEQGVPDAGRRLVDAILGKLQMLADHPDAGRKVPEFDQENIREIIHAPFRIVYLRNTTDISLIRIWRSERLLHFPEDGA